MRASRPHAPRTSCGRPRYALDSTGNVNIRGKLITGTIKTTKMKNTVIIRKDYLHYIKKYNRCLLYTSPSPRDGLLSRMPSSA